MVTNHYRKRDPGSSKLVKVSATCLAEFVTSGRSASLAALLRPYKENKKGKGFIRSVYYRPALLAIRKYLACGRDSKALREATLDLQKKAGVAKTRAQQVRCERNVQAIEAYARLYGTRNFVVQSNRRLAYKLGPIILTAEPDLWVTENGIPVLLKIGLAKRKRDFVDVVLTVIRKAAVSNGCRVRAKNIVYLNIRSGEEMICRGPLRRFNQTFLSAARQIARAWPNVEPANSSPTQKSVQPPV